MDRWQEPRESCRGKAPPRVVISIDLLMRSVAVDVDAAMWWAGAAMALHLASSVAVSRLFQPPGADFLTGSGAGAEG